MSHQVMISYQGITIETQAKCDIAISSLCKIDKVLNKIHNTASTLITSKVKEYEKYLLDSKQKIKEDIESFNEFLEEYKNAKSDRITYLNYQQQVLKKSNELLALANDLTGSKLAIIDEMIDEELLNAGQELFNSLEKKENGVLNLDNNMMKKINSIEDISLRELSYREYLKNKDTSFEKIKMMAQNEYDILLGKKVKEVITETKEQLSKSGIETNIIDNTMKINEVTSIANDAIIDEQIRKETLKIIIKSIKSRGFIVDTKNNLKIDKKKNIVKLVAMKVSGQKAEFEIQLNGKFMYHFDNYEGQACKKDIEPFIEDLKNIYDIDIKHEEVIWENPDKIQTQKYQYVNKNKGKY